MTLPSPRAWLALLVAALVVAAVRHRRPRRRRRPSASPEGLRRPSHHPGRGYRLVNEQVREIRGLEERKPIEPQLVTREELGEVIRSTFDEDYPPARRSADERLYHALGLLNPEVSLKDVYLELLETQVGGLYDPSPRACMSGPRKAGSARSSGCTTPTSTTHALQDQHFDLETLLDTSGRNGDRKLAAQALVEGDAYMLMTYWLREHLTGAELGEVVAASADPEALAALERIPAIVQAQLLFAARQGTQFVLGQQVTGGWAAIDAMYADLPVSSEQILDPEKWAAREEPVEVALPDDLATRLGAGWSVRLEDTLRPSSRRASGSATTTGAAAAGWGGDRLVLLRVRPTAGHSPGGQRGTRLPLRRPSRPRPKPPSRALWVPARCCPGRGGGALGGPGQRRRRSRGHRQRARSRRLTDYIDSGAEIPSKSRVRARVTWAA